MHCLYIAYTHIAYIVRFCGIQEDSQHALIWVRNSNKPAGFVKPRNNSIVSLPAKKISCSLSFIVFFNSLRTWNHQDTRSGNLSFNGIIVKIKQSRKHKVYIEWRATKTMKELEFSLGELALTAPWRFLAFADGSCIPPLTQFLSAYEALKDPETPLGTLKACLFGAFQQIDHR